MSDWGLSRWLGKRPTGPVEPVLDSSEALPSRVVWNLLDVWLEQATSLSSLGLIQAAQRKLHIAADVAARSANANPASALAWVNLARVRVAAENWDGATSSLDNARRLSKDSANQQMLLMIGYLADVISRRRGNADGCVLDGISGMFHICQKCGHIISFIGGHCPHCHFVPTSSDDVRMAIVLSRQFFSVPMLLSTAVKIQFREPPEKFIEPTELKYAFGKISDEDCDATLAKIELHAADDHLDFSALEKCDHCEHVVWESWADKCKSCSSPLLRPELRKFVICVERVLHHFIFFVRHENGSELTGVVTLLVWMKQAGLREQIGPSVAQRELLLANLPRLSPMYSQNGAGVVHVDKDCRIRGEVLNSRIDTSIDGTVQNFTRELAQLVRYLRNEISLF